MNTISNKLVRNALGVALGLCVATVPGYCGTSLQFTSGSNTAGTGTITGDNSSETLTALSGFSISTLVITGDTKDTADNGTWTITGGTESLVGNDIVVTGDITGCLGGSTCSAGNLSGVNGNLETLVYTTAGLTEGGVFTATANNAEVNIGYGASTSITELLALANDLSGLTANTATTQSNSLTSGTIETTGVVNTLNKGTVNQTTTITPYSITNLDVTLNSVTAVPEPVSFLLFGTGLLGVALVARRRSVRA